MSIAVGKPAETARASSGPAVTILTAIAVSHFFNDTIQSLLAAIYPLLKDSFQLNFGQIGLITFVFQLTASLLQPLVGYVTDLKPMPYALTLGMGSSLVGLLLLSVASTYALLLLAAALVGLGSSIFHPDASRVTRMASGGRHGMAQSVFQVGGQLGSTLGPILAALVVVPFGQGSIAWFSVLALMAMIVLWLIGRWASAQRRSSAGSHAAVAVMPFARGKTAFLLFLLGTLVFSKFFYIASFTSYYTFYLNHRFGVSITYAQFMLSIYLASTMVGAVIGGTLGDYFGRKYIIVISIFGVLPFSLLLPHVDLTWTAILTVMIGLIMSSAFSSILVYGHELLPGRVGSVSGLFFGFAFGMGGLGAALLGILADHTSLDVVYEVCAFLPAIGLVALLLPDLGSRIRRRAA